MPALKPQSPAFLRVIRRCQGAHFLRLGRNGIPVGGRTDGLAEIVFPLPQNWTGTPS